MLNLPNYVRDEDKSKQLLGRGFRYPHGIAVKGAYIFVSDQNNNKIKKIDPTQNTTIDVAGTGSTLKGPSNQHAEMATFNFNGGIAFDSSGNLYIADAWHQAIKILSADEKTVYTFLESFVQDLDGKNIRLQSPRSLALDKTEKFLIIANCDAGDILKIDIETKICMACLHVGKDSGLPVGLAFDRNNNLYITHSEHVMTVGADFQTITPFLSYLQNPKGLLFDLAGNLWVAEDDCIKKYNLETKQAKIKYELDWPVGMAFDAIQNLIVSEYNAHKVFRFTIRNLLPWKCRRLIWIGFMKNKPFECLLASLPKEIIQEIINFLWDYYY